MAPRRFCPEGTVSRAEGALALWRGLHARSSPPESGHWPVGDLGDGQAADAAAALWRAGYLDLCDVLPPRFCPSDPLLRGTLAAWVLRVHEGRTYIPPRPEGHFSDGPVGAWATWWLEPASAAGLIPPCRQGADRVCPDGIVNRADLAWSLAAALGSTR